MQIQRTTSLARILPRLAATMGLLWTGPALAEAKPPMKAEALVMERKCFACHHRTETRIGPSYDAIAMRWSEATPAAVDILTEKILEGGGGNWGLVPMVPNRNRVSETEAREVARWILSLKPAR